MTKEEMVKAFDDLKAGVADFAKPTVSTPPTDVIDTYGYKHVGGNPGTITELGEESTVGHIHHYLDDAKALAVSLVGK